MVLVVENRRCERRGVVSRCMVLDISEGKWLGNCLESEHLAEAVVDMY
jgi:hypothetical protein